MLMSYRKTLHSTMDSPKFGRRSSHSRLELMILSKDPKRSEVQSNVRELTMGTTIAIREYVHKNKWEFGIVEEWLGKLCYFVQLNDLRILKRHIDQPTISSYFDRSNSFNGHSISKGMAKTGRSAVLASLPADQGLRRSQRTIKSP